MCVCMLIHYIALMTLLLFFFGINDLVIRGVRVADQYLHHLIRCFQREEKRNLI